MPPCLTLSIIRYGSRVKWSNPGKGVAPSPTPWCSSYQKGSLWVTLEYGRQLYLLTYLYISLFFFFFLAIFCQRYIRAINIPHFLCCSYQGLILILPLLVLYEKCYLILLQIKVEPNTFFLATDDQDGLSVQSKCFIITFINCFFINYYKCCRWYCAWTDT